MTKSKKIVAVLGVVAGLGAIAFPLTSYAATQDVNITVGVDETVAISVNNPSVSKNIATNAAIDESMTTTATVTVNSSKGYKLSIYGSGGGTVANSLYRGATTDAIPAGVPAQGQSYWGYKGGNTNDLKAVPLQASADLIKTTTEASTTGDQTLITFGVTASVGQTPGSYTGKVTLSAVLNE